MTKDNEMPFVEKEVRDGPLAMITKEGCKLNLLSNSDDLKSDFWGWEEDLQLAFVKNSSSMELGRDLTCSQDSFKKLLAFSKFLGFSVDGYEEEILGLFRNLEFRANKKSLGQVVKKARSDGSKLEREIRKLECSISYKTKFSSGRAGRSSSEVLVEVCP